MALRLFLAYFIFTSGLVAGQTVYKLKGEESNFKPHITGRPDNILWKHKGNKVVEFDGKEQQVYSTYKTRITLDWHTAELTISDLSFEDSGGYELEAFKSGGNLETSYFNLVVMDKVAKPTISCKMNNGSIISGTLMCSAEPRQPPSLMKFEWSSSGDVQPGPQLTIKLGEKLDDEVYTCSVSNPLSKETATFTAKDCYPADKSSNVAAIVIPVLLLLFIIIIGLAVFYIRKKKAYTRKRKDLENQPLRGPPEETKLLKGSVHEQDSSLSQEETHTSQQPQSPIPKGFVAAKRKAFERENGVNTTDEKMGCDRDPAHIDNESANPQQVIEEKEKNSPEPDSFSCEKREGSESDEDNRLDDGRSAFPQDQAPEQGLGKGEDEEQNSDPACLKDATDNEESDTDQLTGENVREPDSSGIHQERNELCDSAKEKQSTTIPEHKSPETSEHEYDSNLLQGETDTGKDIKQETDKPVSEDVNQKSVSTSQQPQSPIQKGFVAAKKKAFERENGGSGRGREGEDEEENSTPTSLKDATDKEESDTDQLTGENVREPDSSGIHQERNELCDSAKEKQSTTIPEHKSPETSEHEHDSNLLQGETDTGKDIKQETDKPVSEDVNESDNLGECKSSQTAA